MVKELPLWSLREHKFYFCVLYISPLRCRIEELHGIIPLTPAPLSVSALGGWVGGGGWGENGYPKEQLKKSMKSSDPIAPRGVTSNALNYGDRGQRKRYDFNFR